MCGIAGFVNRDGRAADRAVVERMTGTLAHRGPDGDGFHLDGPLALGHRRLAIIDVQGGAQPMANEDEHGLGHLQRRALQRVRPPRRASAPRPSLPDHLRYREPRPSLRGARTRLRPRPQRHVRPRPLGREPPSSRPGPRPDGPETPLPRRATRRRPRLRLRAEGAARPSRVGRTLDHASLARYLFYEYLPAPSSIWANVRKLPPAHF